MVLMTKTDVLKSLDKQFPDKKLLFVDPAGVDVERHVIGLGPGVHRKMRLADDHNAADPVGRKPVEGNVPDLRVGLLRGLHQNVLQLDDIGDDLAASGRLHNEMNLFWRQLTKPQ